MLEFTHDREVGWLPIASVLGVLFIAEGTLVHWWLAGTEQVWMTWLAGGLHLVGLVWLLVDTVALRMGRTRLTRETEPSARTLELRMGVRARGTYPLAALATVETGSWDSAPPGERLVRVVGPANVRLRFTEPMLVRSLLGRPTPVTGLLIQIDHPSDFERALSAYAGS